MYGMLIRLARSLQRFHGHDQARLRLHQRRGQVHSVSVCSVQHQQYVHCYTRNVAERPRRRLLPPSLQRRLHAPHVPLHHLLVSAMTPTSFLL